MKRLYFKKPVFNAGKNLTVRRGVKWAMNSSERVVICDADGEPCGVGKITHISVMRFKDLDSSDLINEHDPRCRNWAGLYNVMHEICPRFTMNEIVTLIEFEVEK